MIGLVEGRIDLGGSTILGGRVNEVSALMGSNALLKVWFGRGAIARWQQAYRTSDVAGWGGAPDLSDFGAGCRLGRSR